MDKEKVVLADVPGLGRIHLCECEAIHLNIGPVTINLAPAAFAQTAIMIRQAMEQLALRVGMKDLQGNGRDAPNSSGSRFTN